LIINLCFYVEGTHVKNTLTPVQCTAFSVLYNDEKHIQMCCLLLAPGAAFEGGKWGDRHRPRASGLWVCQAIFSGELGMLIHAPFKIFKVKFRSVVLGCLLYCNRLHVAPVVQKYRTSLLKTLKLTFMIVWKTVINNLVSSSLLHVWYWLIWKMTIIISLLDQRRCLSSCHYLD